MPAGGPTHTATNRYTALGLTVHDVDIDLGHVGFRTVEVDRTDGAFTFSVNGVAIFCRGALWVPPDVVTLRASEADLRQSLLLVVDAGMNHGADRRLHVVRGSSVSGTSAMNWGSWSGKTACWPGFDPPEEPEFVESVSVEVSQQLSLLQGRPSLALVCSSSETHQQAAMFGLPSDRWQSPLLQETIPALVHATVPGVPCLVSSPTGGDLPFEPGQGVAHYFGVGAYLRPLSDARLAGVRFAAECLAFGNPPEKETVEQCFGGSAPAGHHPTWKAGVARDSGTSWDFEDVRDHYVGQVFGVNPFTVRYADPDLYLDYGRATVSHLMATVLAEWRCAQSICAGALVLSWQDIRPGAGWGLLDSFAIPKAPWYALRRVLAPVAVLMTDEGLAGLRIHVLNDRQTPLTGRLRLTLFNMSGAAVEEVERAVVVGGRSEQQWNAASLLEGFRDVTNAYRFGPPTYDVIRARLECDEVVTEDFFLPAGSDARVSRTSDWRLEPHRSATPGMSPSGRAGLRSGSHSMCQASPRTIPGSTSRPRASARSFSAVGMPTCRRRAACER